MNKFAKSSNIDKEGKYVSLPDWQKRKTICKGEKCQNCWWITRKLMNQHT